MITRKHRTTDDILKLAKNLQAKAESIGNDKLGGGLFAKTYSHPNPALAVKIAALADQCNRGYKDPATQDGYMVYLDKIAKYPSKFAPKVFSCDIIQHVERERGVVVVVTLERLIPNRDVCTTLQEQRAYGKIIDPMLADVGDLTNKYREVMKSADPHAANLAKALCETWIGHGKDLHGGNWMLRKTATGYIPVITDPAA